MNRYLDNNGSPNIVVSKRFVLCYFCTAN